MSIKEKKRTIKPGLDVLFIGEVALEGGLHLLEEEKEKLESRFIPGFFKNLKNRQGELDDKEILALIEEHDTELRYPLGDVGFLGALWDISHVKGVGMEVDLKKLPITQEVIEISEYLGHNPYRLPSAGAVILVMSQGEQVANILAEAGYQTTVIGKTIEEKQAKIRCGEDIRFLEAPKS